MTNAGAASTFAILGCGGRGQAFADILHARPALGTVTAIAEPDAGRRQALGDRHRVADELRFADWRELLARPRLADVAIVALMDQQHRDAAVPALDLGYHLLLEKPMATTIADCRAIDDARRRNARIVSVCHSLRYDQTYAEIKRLLVAGEIGEIVSLDQLEAVNHVHQSHSFVRGNWGNESRATFMLMAKSCHDLDIIAHLVARPCRRVSSFGSLTKFRAEHAPTGAPARCIDGCPAEARCPYSTYKVYSGADSDRDWYPAHAGMAGLDAARRIELLRTSPYGRCVYRCDNDVVDHQVVACEFDGGITATFTMTGMTQDHGRFVRIHGTDGVITAAITDRRIEVQRFADGSRRTIVLPSQHGTHGGADDATLRALVGAVRGVEPDAVLTTTAESLASHLVVFAAERSRRERRTVELSELA